MGKHTTEIISDTQQQIKMSKLKTKQNQSISSPTILVIFGMTGDLATKKIIPSLWFLFQQHRLPEKISIVGFSRRTISDQDFRDYLLQVLTKLRGERVDDVHFSQFCEIFSYQQGAFEDGDAFRSLSEKIHAVETAWNVCANKLFYLAVPPKNYKVIFKNLERVKLNIPCGGELGWSRVLIEKPFGLDLASARELQKLLRSYFKEEQIYRIDHYLFKEIIQGIENFRFSNNLFENIWDNTSIERIDLVLRETIGAEDRGSFYDSVGALRDVGQNHLLSILTSLTMDYPLNTQEAGIPDSRADALATLAPWTENTLRQKTYRAQYNGYSTIEGVGSNSDAETFFALQTELLHPKWKGVPITIHAGKRLAETRKEIMVTLKHPAVCHLCAIDPNHNLNTIIFRFAPNDEVIINFWTKKPGFEKVLEERSFSFFLYEKKTKMQYVEEYAKVLYSAINGEQSLFVSFREVEAEWKFTEPIVEYWKRSNVPLGKYEVDTDPQVSFLGRNIKNAEVPDKKEVGVIGLGKMGANLARQMISKGWKVYGFNRSPEITRELETEGLQGEYTLTELINKLAQPRVVWLMVPHHAVESLVEELLPLLHEGDTVIDGGNSPYKQSMKLHSKLKERGIRFLDVGVSGGPGGARYGACMMIGGEKSVYQENEVLFRSVAIRDGYVYVGSSGAGHFVKMIHNGIEYGMMQALGEGFAILKKSPFTLDLHSIANLYNHGSVITSRLVGWLAEVYAQFGDNLDNEECCSGKVTQSGEGEWTVEAAGELSVPAPIIKGSVEFRKQSQNKPSYTGQVISALRHQFGGHSVNDK